MSRVRISALVILVLGIAALGGAEFSPVSGGAHKWLNFYIWKLASGKAHGGERASINDASIYYETYGA